MQVEPRGTLRLSASVTFGQRITVPRLSGFRARYPAVTVEGLFSDSIIDLVADRVDLAIRLAPMIDGNYVVSKLMDTRYRVVAAPDCLRRSSRLEQPEDLAHHRAILFPYRDYRSRWIFRDAAGALTEQAVEGDLVPSPAGAIHYAALAGLGRALLPDWLISDEIEQGLLHACIGGWDVTATRFDTAAWLIYRSRSFLPAKVRAMIEFLRRSMA